MTKSASELLEELDKVAATFPGVALDDNIPPPIEEALIAIGTLRGALPELRAVVEAASQTWCVTSYREGVICSRGGIGCPLPHPEDAALAALREKLEQA